MKIVQYIYELIQENGSLIIPDFGAFILKDTSTRIDNNKKIISPPSKVLTFDENIKDKDNTLVDYIIKTDRISKEAAEEGVFKFVYQLKSLLTSGKTIDFRNIGKLHLNHKKQIVFDVDSKVEYVSDSFGLTSIKIKTFAKTKETKQNEIKEKTPKVKKPKKKFPKAAIWIIIIFIPIAAVTILAFVFPDKTKEIYSNTKNSIINLFKKTEPDNKVKIIASNKDTLKNTVKINVVDTVSNKPIENNLENNSSKENKHKPEANTIVDANKKYHIIVGCFQSKSNADNYFKTIEGKGYTPRMFEAGSDGLYKISCGSYSTREEANRELKKVFQDIGSQAWILKK